MDAKVIPAYRLLIGGRLQDGDASMPVIDPATGLPFTECPRASPAQAQAAIEAAHRAFPAWSQLALARRQQCLSALADALERRLEEFSRLLTQEQGKPLAESQWEIGASVAFLRYFATVDLPVKVLEDSAQRRVELHRRALGVVAAIIPWNFPLLLIQFKLPAALLAGNTMVIKPAPTTPLTTLRFGELCAEVLPPGVVNVVTDQNDLGGLLTSHPLVRKVAFTGSGETGRKVMASAAATLKRFSLELGGNDAAVVLPDADVEAIAPQLFAFAFMNCGQVCLAIKRLYVHDSLYERMCEALARIASATQVGNGLDAGTQMGPMQNRRQYDKVLGLIEDARQHGRIIAGGKALPGGGFFLQPTIVRDADNGQRIVDEEQFGPVLPLIRYREIDEVLQRVNASPMGLGGSVWGRDLQQARAVALRINSGTVWINKHIDVAPNIPMGGARESGLGVELGEAGLAEFTQAHVLNMPPLAAPATA